MQLKLITRIGKHVVLSLLNIFRVENTKKFKKI